MAALMHQPPAATKGRDQASSVDNAHQQQALRYIRDQFPDHRIKFLYNRGQRYYFRVNLYARDLASIVSSDFIEVLLSDTGATHQVQTVAAPA